jgi:hypothetical protein
LVCFTKKNPATLSGTCGIAKEVNLWRNRTHFLTRWNSFVWRDWTHLCDAIELFLWRDWTHLCDAMELICVTQFYLHAQVVGWKTDVVELVLAGPALGQRRIVLIHHRVQDLQALVKGQVGVLEDGKDSFQQSIGVHCYLNLWCSFVLFHFMFS